MSVNLVNYDFKPEEMQRHFVGKVVILINAVDNIPWANRLFLMHDCKRFQPAKIGNALFATDLEDGNLYRWDTRSKWAILKHQPEGGVKISKEDGPEPYKEIVAAYRAKYGKNPEYHEPEWA